jgi:hypothetical protein
MVPEVAVVGRARVAVVAASRPGHAAVQLLKQGAAQPQVCPYIPGRQVTEFQGPALARCTGRTSATSAIAW